MTNYTLSLWSITRMAFPGIIVLGLWNYHSKPETSHNVVQPTPPEENRFTKIVLAEKLDEPMEMAPLRDGRVLFIERKGNVKLYSPDTKQVKVITTIPVSTKYTDKEGKQTEAEDGLLGLTLDPGFEQNHWLYLYYSPAGETSENILARYELRGDELVLDSKKVILHVATQREQCCHTGGSMAFDGNGNLFLSTGDNTSPRATGFSPLDERPGRSPWDAQKSSGNTNDLRGKVLRIHPEPDGSYTVPEGNLFPKGTAKTRSEIYTMGHRNPYRISVDKKTGYLYWGDVGADSGVDSTGRGARGHDEFNQAKQPGNFGWPYFQGNNKPFWDYDFATGKSGSPFDPTKPVNNSPNNTGLTELPPAQNAMIWYPANESILFPQLGKGGRSAMAGPVYYKDDFRTAKRAFPDYYNGKLFIYEWMRGWILAVTLDEDGNYLRTEPFMPSHKFSNPIELEFGPEGDLYMLEYGTGWFQGNDDARLVRIEYNGGNRKPIVEATVDKKIGATPLAVKFSSEGTQDYDRDALTYDWTITDKKGIAIQTFKESNPTYTFTKPGVYNVVLTVSDGKGEPSIRSMEIVAGNEAPKLTFSMNKGNRSFYFPNKPFEYAVAVTDKEDGSLANGKILPAQVAVTIDYLKDGVDPVEIEAGHRTAEASASLATGKKLMDANDCRSCHFVDKKSVGPAYQLVAQKYKGDPQAADRLTTKVVQGGGGVWGDAVMPAHPQLSVSDAREIVQYVLSLGDTKAAAVSLPVKGSYTPKVTTGNDQGAFIIRAAYKDKGANGVPSASAEDVLVLRNPSVPAGNADKSGGVQKFKLPEPPVEMVIAMAPDNYIGFSKTDLTSIDQVTFVVSAPVQQLNAAGGVIEVHLDSPTGPMIGQSSAIVPKDAPITGTSFTPDMVKAKLTPTQGIHDVYYVFKNDKSGGKPLFIVLTLQYSAGENVASGK
ncbi:PQQ-dependent sugar dehydrogenase [Cytophagaceae bacterium YF14B1]|uniref:PQQ-dependent sugar dehydrogenase n=1 Tax=Xanthocytophaga flava TaxID=3048013 RepID=A0AAE3QM21_9BACT|nr:PQQ-dependent sugar dehydrogenase [Xanthocytophaga flavus]MDJ1481161.1 PQQ-dependent sugar dehydrogenase [Xanthocytophaga flavus]